MGGTDSWGNLLGSDLGASLATLEELGLLIALLIPRHCDIGGAIVCRQWAPALYQFAINTVYAAKSHNMVRVATWAVAEWQVLYIKFISVRRTTPRTPIEQRAQPLQALDRVRRTVHLRVGVGERL